MAYDYARAKESGLTDKEISEYLSGKANYNLKGALESGLSYEEINNHLVNKQNTVAEAPGMISELGTNLVQRGRNILETLNPSQLAPNSPREAQAAALQAQIPNADPRSGSNFGTGLNVIGDIAGGAGEIIGTGVEAAYKGGKYLYDPTIGVLVNEIYDIAPQSIKDTATDIQLKAMDNPVTQAGLSALKGGMETWGSFKESNPGIAKNIESVFNIGMLVGPKGSIGKSSTLIGKAKALTAAAKQDVITARSDFLRNLITPLSASKRKKAGVQAAAQGRQLTATDILLSAEEKEKIQVLKNIPSINELNSDTKNNNNLLAAISLEGQSLEKATANSTSQIRQMELSNALETAKQDALRGLFIEPGSDKKLEGYVNSAINTMERIYSQEKAKGVSDSVAMLRARKLFDNEIKNAGGPDALNPEQNSVLSRSAKEIRNATHELLIAANPDIGIRQSLNIQHRLYQAGDELAEKAYQETISKFGKAMQVVNDILPVKYKLAATLGIVGATSSTIPVLAAVGGVYGIYLGSRFVTGPAAKEALAKVLLASDRAIAATKNAKEIIALQAGKQTIEELISTIDMQDQQNLNAVQSQIPSGQPAFVAPLAAPVTPPLPGPVAQTSPQDMPFNALQGTGIAQALRPQEAYRQAMTGIGGR
jgi:hypothetical protein